MVFGVFYVCPVVRLPDFCLCLGGEPVFGFDCVVDCLCSSEVHHGRRNVERCKFFFICSLVLVDVLVSVLILL